MEILQKQTPEQDDLEPQWFNRAIFRGRKARKCLIRGHLTLVFEDKPTPKTCPTCDLEREKSADFADYRRKLL